MCPVKWHMIIICMAHVPGHRCSMCPITCCVPCHVSHVLCHVLHALLRVYPAIHAHFTHVTCSSAPILPITQKPLDAEQL